MVRLRTAVPLLLLVACGKVTSDNPDAAVTADAVAEPDAAEAPADPRTCAEWQARGKSADGTYAIDPDGRGGAGGFDVHCAGMVSASPAPREYLALARTSSAATVEAALAAKDPGAASNYSVHPAGGTPCAGDAIRTYQRVRLDPSTLRIDTTDRTFSTIEYTGGTKACYEEPANNRFVWMALAMRFGDAADCRGRSSSGGVATIDLRDTPFVIGHDVAWSRWPTYEGTAWPRVAADRKTAIITAGGGCGLSFVNGGVLPLAHTTALPPFAPALVNGGFTDGLAGWTRAGDDGTFSVATADALGKRKIVSSRAAGAPARGTLYQDFVVPHDALLVLFALQGTGGRVALLDVEKNQEIASFQPVGRDDVFVEGRQVLRSYVGRKVRILIEDADAGAYLTTSGFEVIRGGVVSPLRNANWHDEGVFAGWTSTGDLVTAKVDEYVNTGDGQYNGYWTLRTGPAQGPAQGVVYQTFDVPADAVGLRFAVAAGVAGMEVRLYRGAITSFPAANPARSASSPGAGFHAAVSWDLTELRGQRVTFAIEDASAADLGSQVVHEVQYISERSGP